MTARSRRFIGEIAFCGFLAATGFVALHGLQDLSRSPFDYLGSADVPRLLAWLVIGLSTLIAIKLIIAHIRGGPDIRSRSATDGQDTDDARQSARRIWQVILICTASLAYVVSIIWALLPYSVSTAALLIFGMAVLAPRKHRRLEIIVPLSLLMGAAGEFVFVHLLVLPFPGW